MNDPYLIDLAKLEKTTRNTLAVVRLLMDIEKKKTTPRGKRLRRIERHLMNAANACRIP